MYYVVYGFIKLLSFLPLPVLHLFSDLVYFFIYYVTGYRKKVVMNNLLIAFPEKTGKERIRIAKDFYHSLVDTFIETIKFFSWSYKDINKRVTVDLTGLELAYKTGKPVHVLAMHNMNWEFINWWISKNAPIPFVGIYLPMGNKIFDRMMRKMRGKYGTILIPATKFKENYIQYIHTPHLLGTAADQSPANPKNAWWLNFFGRRTAFIKGPEKGATAINACVIFVHFYKTKRGHYHIDSFFYKENAAQTTPGEITRDFASFVESSIRAQPANYLWSHRRWKHEWKEEYRDITLDSSSFPS